MSSGHSAHCTRCGALLYRYPKGGLDTALALSLTALILFMLANVFPFMALEIEGRTQETTLAGAFWSLYQADRIWLALVVLFTSIIGPSIVIISGLYVLTSIHWSLHLPGVRPTLQIISHIRPWGMLDVFMLGVLVSFVKLEDLAEVLLGPGLYAFSVLLLVSAAMAAYFEPKQLWDRLDQR